MLRMPVCVRGTLRVRSGKLTPRRLCWSSGEAGRHAVFKARQPQQESISQVNRRNRKVCQLILDHFNQQYSEELGDLWASVRSVLLDPHSWQYAVLLNRFSVVTDIKRVLLSQGFSTLLPQKDALTLPSVGPTAFNADCQTSKNSHAKCPNSRLQLQNSSRALIQQPESQPWLHPPSLSLQCYIHPYPLRFPSQAHRAGQLKQYYLLNAASLLPVLALQVRNEDKVLDLCAAPGGKALAIMQCASPAFLCCNEPDSHRRGRLTKTLESFLPRPMSSRVVVSAQDGRSFGQREAGNYDKVLVDAPCSNDRSWLFSSADQQVEQRLKERSRLPQLQVQLLRSALSAVRPGGIVVYSTCTMSTAENFAVVEAVLRDCPEAEPEDLWEEIAFPLSTYFTFQPAHRGSAPVTHTQPLQPRCGRAFSYDHKLGILVLPQPCKTWGPMFLSRLRRTRK